MSILISEDHVNLDKGWRFGDSAPYETHFETPGEAYKACLREFGRCTGKVYIDDGPDTKHIGWVFQKRDKYEDSNDTYLHETWITLHDAPDTITRTPHFHVI